MFYNVVPLAYALGFGDVPFVLNEPAYTNPLNNPQVVFPRVFPATGTGGPSSVGLPAAQNPDYKTPYSMQYNFTIERQQWNTGFRVSYIGTALRKGPWMYNYNSPVPDSQPFTEKSRPFNNLPEVWYVTNGAGHQYNGLTVRRSASCPADSISRVPGPGHATATISITTGTSIAGSMCRRTLRPQTRNRSRARDPDTPVHE